MQGDGAEGLEEAELSLGHQLPLFPLAAPCWLCPGPAERDLPAAISLARLRSPFALLLKANTPCPRERGRALWELPATQPRGISGVRFKAKEGKSFLRHPWRARKPSGR